MKRWVAAAAGLLAAACGETPPATQDARTGYGPSPALVAPEGGLPVVNVATPAPWAAGEGPTAPAGFAVTRYAEELAHPRWLYRLPNGDVLVAEASTRPTRGGGVMGWITNQVMRAAGALGDSADRITLLRDADGDGDVDQRGVLIENLNQPFGMALIGSHLYFGNTDAVLRFPYTEGQTRIDAPGEIVARLPYNAGDNGHWTRDLLASADGARLYVGIGSASNIADDGLEVEEGRAAIWEIDLASGRHRIFASGLRNPNGLAWNPESGALWAAVNERDMLGDDLVPDYMTSVRDGDFFGWPWSYWGDHVDARVTPANPAMVARARAPDFALGAHTASLGVFFYTGAALPARYRNGAFVGQHGSWNRRAPAGYRVIFVPFTDGRPQGAAEDFLTDFITEDGRARGRPVGVAMDRAGALLVADDLGNIVWRVAPES